MSELIALGTGATTAWFDVTVASNSTKALYIKAATTGQPIPPGVEFEIAHKDPAGNYTVFDKLNARNIRDKGLIGTAGTFGLRRLANTVSAGLDVEG